MHANKTRIIVKKRTSRTKMAARNFSMFRGLQESRNQASIRHRGEGGAGGALAPHFFG